MRSGGGRSRSGRRWLGLAIAGALWLIAGEAAATPASRDGAGACVMPPAGMVGWWPMDEGAGATALMDLAAGNHAIPLDSPVGAPQGPQPGPGVVGGALHYPKFRNGLSGSKVGVGGALAGVGAADFSVEAWVLVLPAPADRLHQIVNRFDTDENRGYSLSVRSGGAGGAARLEFRWGDGATTGTLQSGSPLTTAAWHHVAVTLARGTATADVRLYVDGVLQGQRSIGAPGLGSLVSARAQPSALAEPISIDELTIFDVALSASDVQAIHDAGSAGKCRCVTGGQSVDLTVVASGAVSGAGSGVGAIVSGPLALNYEVRGCSGGEMFLLVRAPALGLGGFAYYSAALAAFVPLPGSFSLVTPSVVGGPDTADGTGTLFSGTLPPGTYEFYLACDLTANGRLDATGPPLCVTGAFDYLPLTVQ